MPPQEGRRRDLCVRERKILLRPRCQDGIFFSVPFSSHASLPCKQQDLLRFPISLIIFQKKKIFSPTARCPASPRAASWRASPPARRRRRPRWPPTTRTRSTSTPRRRRQRPRRPRRPTPPPASRDTRRRTGVRVSSYIDPNQTIK